MNSTWIGTRDLQYVRLACYHYATVTFTYSSKKFLAYKVKTKTGTFLDRAYPIAPLDSAAQ